MRSAILLLATLFAVVALVFGLGGVVFLLGIGATGTGLVLLLDWFWSYGSEQRALRRIRRRLQLHSCPDCGIPHGGVGQ